MNKEKIIAASNRKSLIVAALISVAVIWMILSQFATAIIAASIAAFVFIPLEQYLERKLKKKGVSVFITFIISIFAFIIPVALLAWVSVIQVNNIAEGANNILEDGNISLRGQEFLQSVSDRIYEFSDGNITVSVADIQDYLLEVVSSVAEYIANQVADSVSGIPMMVTNLIIFVYVFLALLGSHEKLLNYLSKLNPLGDDATDLYLARAKAMTSGMVKGQFVVAIVQGLIGALSLAAAGIADYFIFFAVILSVLSIIPLGGGIVTIPIALIMMATGNLFGGLLVIAVHFIVVTNIDNYLRPKLVPRSIQLHPALTIIAVLSGLSLFGFLGIVIGPVLFILAVSTLDMLIAQKEKRKLKV